MHGVRLHTLLYVCLPDLPGICQELLSRGDVRHACSINPSLHPLLPAIHLLPLQDTIKDIRWAVKAL